jgi:hypothetical protein
LDCDLQNDGDKHFDDDISQIDTVTYLWQKELGDRVNILLRKTIFFT